MGDIDISILPAHTSRFSYRLDGVSSHIEEAATSTGWWPLANSQQKVRP